MNEKILKCLGTFPKRTELELNIIEEIDCGDYYRRLIEYNVEENQKVKSYLLIPKSIKQKNPAVLAIHQHASQWDIGKSEVVGIAGNRMFAYGLDLVKQGYIVISPDLLCFESRIDEKFIQDKESQKLYERFEFCKYIQAGSCLQTKYIHDLSVAIDVLETLPFVDKNNIGVIGHSLGGQEAIWITWFDKRIKACISSCGVSTVEVIMKQKILHNFALYVPGLQKYCDMDEVIYQIAPRNILITSGLGDERHFPLEGIEKIEIRNKNNENFKSIKFEDGHLFNDQEKEIAYKWLSECLS